MPAIREEAPADDMQLDSIVDLINEGAAAVTMDKEVQQVCLVAGMSENEAGGVITELFSPPRFNQQIPDGAKRSCRPAAGNELRPLPRPHHW